MSTRAQRRRHHRAAAKGRLPVKVSHGKKKGRVMPSDHPDRAASPLLTTKEAGIRMTSVVDRSDVAPPIERKFTGERGRKKTIPYRALLVAMMLAMDSLGRSYTRADVCAAIVGMKSSVARELGILDEKGKWTIPSYKTVCRMFKKLEEGLLEGWNDGETRCDLEWYAASLLRASVPRKVRRSVDTIVIDSTAVKAFGCTSVYAKQKELEKDAYANYRKESLENPDLPDPELRAKLLAEEAERQGLRVGPDNRIIRGADEDARAGWKTATSSEPAGYFVGYELTAGVSAQSVSWNGKEATKYRLGPEYPKYILAISMNPAGNNPGPAGTETVRAARNTAKRIRRVVADRGFTLKRDTFLREMHADKLDVVMDYKQSVVATCEPTTLGQRKQPVFMHCGTPMPKWTPKYWRKPPAEILNDEEALTKWYNRRAALYRYSFHDWLKRGGMRLQCPRCAGRIGGEAATEASGSYKKPLRKVPPAGQCCGGKVRAAPVEVDQFQKLPYGTSVWQEAYHPPRALVEGTFSAMKHKGGLSKGTCQARGLAANTMAAIAAAVAHNLREAVSHGVTEAEFEDDGPDGGQDDAPTDVTPSNLHDGTGDEPGRAPPPT